MTEPLSLQAAERELALDEVRAVLALARDDEHRRALAGLEGALEEGAVPGGQTELLERIVALGLQSGRIRALYGPGGEQAALRLHRRLPGGTESALAAAEVSQALATLRGKTIESIAVQPVGPGAFTVAVSADGVDVSVRLDRQGARLTSVGV